MPSEIYNAFVAVRKALPSERVAKLSHLKTLLEPVLKEEKKGESPLDLGTELSTLSEGQTELWRAVSQKDVEIVKLLIAAGANVNGIQNLFGLHQTPIDIAIINQHVDIFIALYNAGAVLDDLFKLTLNKESPFYRGEFIGKLAEEYKLEKLKPEFYAHDPRHHSDYKKFGDLVNERKIDCSRALVYLVEQNNAIFIHYVIQHINFPLHNILIQGKTLLEWSLPKTDCNFKLLESASNPKWIYLTYTKKFPDGIYQFKEYNNSDLVTLGLHMAIPTQLIRFLDVQLEEKESVEALEKFFVVGTPLNIICTTGPVHYKFEIQRVLYEKQKRNAIQKLQDEFKQKPIAKIYQGIIREDGYTVNELKYFAEVPGFKDALFDYISSESNLGVKELQAILIADCRKIYTKYANLFVVFDSVNDGFIDKIEKYVLTIDKGDAQRHILACTCLDFLSLFNMLNTGQTFLPCELYYIANARNNLIGRTMQDKLFKYIITDYEKTKPGLSIKLLQKILKNPNNQLNIVFRMGDYHLKIEKYLSEQQEKNKPLPKEAKEQKSNLDEKTISNLSNNHKTSWGKQTNGVSHSSSLHLLVFKPAATQSIEEQLDRLDMHKAMGLGLKADDEL